MKKIGFIDYYLSEWHANNYPKWFKEAAEELGVNYELAYAWAELDVSPIDKKSSDDWCAAFGATKCNTIAELCEKSDVIVILAPSNPEKHLAYAEEALKWGKRTYIDKTFAPDSATAERIFALGEKYNAPFFSTSALRYSNAVDKLAGVKYLTTTGGGGSFEEYSVHQAEMVIAATKKAPLAVKTEKQGKQYIASVKLEDEGCATMIYSPALSFMLWGEKEDGTTLRADANDAFFAALIRDILRFFETGECSFDPRETLAVMKLREAAVTGMERLGEWIEIE